MDVRYWPLPMFSETDHLIVRQAMALLPKRECEILTLRFWGNLSVTEISISLGMNWDRAEERLTQALLKLRGICLEQPEFSRRDEASRNYEAVSLKQSPSINRNQFRRVK